MKKNLVLFFVFIGIFSYAEDLGVNLDELSSSKEIKFINYEGSHRYVDSYWDIRSIGSKLANFKKDNEVFQYHMKYSIVHAVDNTVSDKSDADIFSIDKDAKIDHIRNVRLVITSYLQKKYGYSQKQANTLSIFLTYYNAVHRGDVEYFSRKYKPVVTKYLNKNNAGISVKYTEWPGKTKLVIPLTGDAKKKNLSSLDTSELTNKKVIEELKKENNKGIEERKDMTELKEKEVKQKEKEIEKEKNDYEKEKTTIEKKEEKIEKEKEKVETIEDQNKKQEEQKKLEEKQKEVEQQKQELQENKETIDNKEKQVETKKEEITQEKQDQSADINKTKTTTEETNQQQNQNQNENKSDIQKVTEELQQKEKELAETKEELNLEKSDNKIIQNKFYYMKNMAYTTEGHYNNEIYIIDAKTRQILLKSPFTRITGKTYYVCKDGVIVISYTDTHNSPHHLMMLDLEKLEMKFTGKENIFWRSFIEKKDDFIYAVIKDEANQDDYYLGKFDLTLKLISKSPVKVWKDSFLSFFEDLIYINDYQQNILILKADDLTVVDTINDLNKYNTADTSSDAKTFKTTDMTSDSHK